MDWSSLSSDLRQRIRGITSFEMFDVTRPRPSLPCTLCAEGYHQASHAINNPADYVLKLKILYWFFLHLLPYCESYKLAPCSESLSTTVTHIHSVKNMQNHLCSFMHSICLKYCHFMSQAQCSSVIYWLVERDQAGRVNSANLRLWADNDDQISNSFHWC